MLFFAARRESALLILLPPRILPEAGTLIALGSTRTKRWEDVQVLLDAGIEVSTTMNVQHIESLNDQVWQITGIMCAKPYPMESFGKRGNCSS